MAYWSIIDSCVKNWQYFPTQNAAWNSMNAWLSYDIVRFKIELGVKQKFICKNVTLRHATSLSYSGPAAGLAVVAMLHEPRPCLLPRPTSMRTDVYTPQHARVSPNKIARLKIVRLKVSPGRTWRKRRCYFIRRGATHCSQITLRTCYWGC